MMSGRLKKQKASIEHIEKMEQISDLKIPPRLPAGLEDSWIMVVLLNMGGPKDISEVRPFLKNLFMDDLIIRFPLAPLLQPFFANLIVSSRGEEAERRYGLIGGGSPIYRSTIAQTQALQAELQKRGRDLKVIYSFNYTEPRAEETIREIKKSGKKYILPLSLYPHYSLATNGSTIHYLKKAAQEIYPELVFLNSVSYYLADSYIDSFIDRIHEQLNPGESLDDFYLLFSAHGLPLYFLTNGDPYPFEIAQSVARIVDGLERTDSWAISYQSAVGPMKWLKPSTDAVIKALAGRGIRKLMVVPISFVTDHIETICEIDIEYRALAKEKGITDFRMSRALECHPGFINALADCAESSLVSEKNKVLKLG